MSKNHNITASMTDWVRRHILRKDWQLKACTLSV